MVIRQGGDPQVIDDTTRFPQAQHRQEVVAKSAGYVTAVKAELLGKAAMLLGAGREKVEDQIDHSVGIIMRRKPGDKISVGDALVEMHYNKAERLAEAIELVNEAYSFGAASITMKPLVLETVS